jgi:hypothetical protein
LEVYEEDLWICKAHVLVVGTESAHDFCLDSCCRTPNPDTFLVLKSPQGKTLKKDLQQAGGVEENAVNSIAAGGYISSTHQSSLEHCASDNLSSAARCRPYTIYNKGAKVKVCATHLWTP